MTIQTTYTQARSNLARLLDQVTQDREVVIIERRGADPVALVAADELSGLLETTHLLRSPANARRLLTALGRPPEPTNSPTLADLHRQVEAQPARAERLKAQNEHLRRLLKTAPPDDKSPEWWDEFEQELRANRLNFPDRELEFD
jgi:antitoxin YefM